MTIEELVKNLEGSLSSLRGLWAIIVCDKASKLFPNKPEREATRLVGRMCSIDNGAPILAATLRELMLLDEIYAKRTDFLRMLSTVPTEQEKLRVGAWYLNHLYSFQHRTFNKDEPAWAPKTLALVLDTASKIICIGVTQAVCNDIPILQGMTKEITRTRLGTAFKGIINKDNENYREHMATVKTQMTSDGKNQHEPKTAQQLYEIPVLENQPDEHSRLPIP